MLNTARTQVDEPDPGEHVRVQYEGEPERATRPISKLTAGPGDGDQAVGLGCGGFPIETGDAAERPEVDRLGVDAVAACDECMAELVQQDGGEERDGGDQARDDAERDGEVDAEEHGDERHAPVGADGNSGVPAQGGSIRWS